MKTQEKSVKRRSTFAVLYYIDKSQLNKSGYCRIYGRITIDKRTAQFSAGQKVMPANWDGKTGRAKGRSGESVRINHALNMQTVKIRQHYDNVVERQGFVSSELVLNALKGIGAKEFMLLKLFAEHNDEFRLRVGVNRAEGTYKHYLYTYDLLSVFIQQKYQVEDISLKSLKLQFINDFDFYLRVERKFSAHTISGHTINLKKMIRRAIRQGSLKVDPFYNYIPEQPKKKCRHLKLEELKRLMSVEIASPQVRHTRDMFVFSCFTGLAYSDLRNLSEKHLVKKPDGSTWIYINRQKTGSESVIKLLDIPNRIIEKYRPERTGDKIFNTVTLSCVCYNLRKLEKICGIDHITFHMARHNFGTHITLSRGVPIETVSKMMGHNSITTTQIYAHITNQKVKDDMKKLAVRLSGKFDTFEDGEMPVGIRLNNNFRSKKKEISTSNEA